MYTVELFRGDRYIKGKSTDDWLDTHAILEEYQSHAISHKWQNWKVVTFMDGKEMSSVCRTNSFG